MATPSPTLYIILEGSNIQDIISNRPGIFRGRVQVVDYDTEGRDPAHLVEVTDENGRTEKAFIRHIEVTKKTINIARKAAQP